jgi:hypothetical protein
VYYSRRSRGPCAWCGREERPPSFLLAVLVRALTLSGSGFSWLNFRGLRNRKRPRPCGSPMSSRGYPIRSTCLRSRSPQKMNNLFWGTFFAPIKLIQQRGYNCYYKIELYCYPRSNFYILTPLLPKQTLKKFSGAFRFFTPLKNSHLKLYFKSHLLKPRSKVYSSSYFLIKNQTIYLP